MRRIPLVSLALLLALVITGVAAAAPLSDTIMVATDGGTFTLELQPNPNGSTPLQGVAFTALLDTEAGGLAIKGTFDEGSYEDGVITGQGQSQLVETYAFGDGALSGSLLSAAVGVEVAGNSLGKVSLTGAAAEVRLPPEESGPAAQGKLAGSLDGGQLSLMGPVELIDGLDYQTEHVEAALQPGSTLVVNIAQGKFQYAELPPLQVQVQIDDSNGSLKVNGTVSNGRYTPSANMDLNASLELLAPFDYKKGNVRATLNSGSVQVEVEGGALVQATFSPIIDVQVDVDGGAGGTLEVSGEVGEGRYEPGEGISLDAELALVPPFEYEKGDVSASLASGTRMTVHIAGSEFLGADFAGVQMTTTLELEGKELNFNGPVDGSLNPDGSVEFVAPLRLNEPFQYQRGDVSATLGDIAPIPVQVVKSEFQYAELENLVVAVSVAVDGKQLVLEGSVDTGLDPSGDVSFVGELKAIESFFYDKGDVSATLNAGQPIPVRVERSQFKFAELEDLQVEVHLGVGNRVLELKGTVDTGLDAQGDVNFESELSTEDSFDYESGDVMGTLKPGAALQVVVESSQFQGATTPEIGISGIEIGGQVVPLGGLTAAQIDQEGQLSFEGQLEPLEDFDYESGEVNTRLKPGGSVAVTVEKSQFQAAEMPDVEVQVSTGVHGDPLGLVGVVEARVDETGKIGFQGDLTLSQPFQYTRSRVDSTLEEGTPAQVSVEDSKFARAELYGGPLVAGLDIPGGNTAHLRGEAEWALLTPDWVLLRADVVLQNWLIVRRGWLVQHVRPGEAKLTLLPNYGVLRVGWRIFLVPLGD